MTEKMLTSHPLFLYHHLTWLFLDSHLFPTRGPSRKLHWQHDVTINRNGVEQGHLCVQKTITNCCSNHFMGRQNREIHSKCHSRSTIRKNVLLCFQRKLLFQILFFLIIFIKSKENRFFSQPSRKLKWAWIMGSRFGATQPRRQDLLRWF
jgi:hypothetical protein